MPDHRGAAFDPARESLSLNLTSTERDQAPDSAQRQLEPDIQRVEGVGTTPSLADTQDVRAGRGSLRSDGPGYEHLDARVARSGRDYRGHPRPAQNINLMQTNNAGAARGGKTR